MKKYVVYVDNEFQSDFDSKESAEKKILELESNRSFKDCSMEIKEITLVNIYANYDEELGGIVSIKISVDDETVDDEFVVQLTGGEHSPQMGCWLLTCNSDGDIDLESYRNGYFAAFSSQIISLAENSYKIFVNEKMLEDVNEGEVFEDYEYFDNQTVSATSSTEMSVEKSNQGRFRVYPKNSGFTQPNDYSQLPDFEIEYFENVQSYNDFRKEGEI